MGIFDRWRESREEKPDDGALDTALRAALGGTPLTVKTALSIPAVAASVGLISGAVATLPVRLYRTQGSRSEEVTNDYRLRLLNQETGDLLDAFQWKATLIRDYLLPGNGYTYVEWVGREIDGLYYLDPTQVSVEVGSDPIHKTASFLVGGKRLGSWQVLRVLRGTTDGATGTGLVAESPVLLDTMLSALEYEGHMVKTGSKKGFLKAKSKLTEEAMAKLKTSWRNLYGNKSEETVVVLNGGLEFQDAGQTAVDTQLNENKVANSREIYKIFGIAPPSWKGELPPGT